MSKPTETEQHNNEQYDKGYKEGRAPQDPLTYIVDSFLTGSDSQSDKGFRQGRADKDTYGPKGS